MQNTRNIIIASQRFSKIKFTIIHLVEQCAKLTSLYCNFAVYIHVKFSLAHQTFFNHEFLFVIVLKAIFNRKIHLEIRQAKQLLSFRSLVVSVSRIYFSMEA